ncbi:Peroxiredoxin [Paenibacillus sp. UNCCL117]|uniref:redoxin domain-containing protein n=1 Tax=unclassified Paenibacillus TaxID=185978 RepID=UPI0008915040|nr:MULTISPECIES: redoxin domain-containing protein [unclassified Paenibacillus]SDC92883.1 Peroxiredoxin [Paenibacillus sp. cl123]SFW29436.1 Peroxiredoxin [Paenibacillus sp. UNCCL117]
MRKAGQSVDQSVERGLLELSRRTGPRSYVNIVIVVALAAVLLYTLLQARTGQDGALRTGDQAPEFNAMTLDGGSVSLAEYQGQGVLLNFWASWCGPCVSEMPRMNDAYREGVPGVAMLAVNVGESRGTAAEFAANHGLSFPVLLDPSGEAAGRYGLVGLPRTFLIDGSGRIARIVTGELASAEQVRGLMESVKP